MPKLKGQSGVTGDLKIDDFMVCMDAMRNFGFYAVSRKFSDHAPSTIGHPW